MRVSNPPSGSPRSRSNAAATASRTSRRGSSDASPRVSSSVELRGHAGRPAIEHRLRQRRRRHRRVRERTREREVQLGQRPAEPHRLREERGVLIVHRGTALRRIAQADALDFGIQVAQRRERQRPALAAVVQKTLHQDEERRGSARRRPDRAAEHWRDVREPGCRERVGHLELVRRPRLDAAQVLEEDRVADLDRRVALLDLEIAHGRERSPVEQRRIRAGASHLPARRGKAPAAREWRRAAIRRTPDHRLRRRGGAASAPRPRGSGSPAPVPRAGRPRRGHRAAAHNERSHRRCR